MIGLIVSTTSPKRRGIFLCVKVLILESVHRLLCGNGIEILPIQFEFDPIVG